MIGLPIEFFPLSIGSYEDKTLPEIQLTFQLLNFIDNSTVQDFMQEVGGALGFPYVYM